MDNLESLKLAVEQANIAKKEATKNLINAENAYAIAKAEVVGIHIGSVIKVKSRKTFCMYRVASISLADWRQCGLKLTGSTIRKDGSEGVKRDIWQDWELEK